MSNAQIVIEQLMTRQRQLLARVADINAEAAALAYRIVVEGSVTAKQRYYALEDEAAQLADDIGLGVQALIEARRRAETAGRDAGQVMAELFNGRQTA